MGTKSAVITRPLTGEFTQGRARIIAAPTILTQAAPPTKPIILIAEDDSQTLELLAMVLVNKGYDVRTACDGVEAVAMAPEVRPDVALLNNLMPRMSGITACGLISEMPCLDGLPIVVYSACSLFQFRPPALAAGAWACWPTPMSALDFVAKTAKVLSGGGRDPESLRRRG